MKTTEYFKYVRQRSDRIEIKNEWIERVMAEPDSRIVQPDGRFRLWKKIPEAGGKYLRVVLLEDGETVHNAFFDRRYKGVVK